ncbi:M20/M25/M40 family metallo-hydrolase [Paenibacillus sp. MDMC362]|uniref:M20/M25/M40 family metallo-hydrolase n=1 Tax=Paenibacillus sp. MDMC362 TaxID=2977365 RepID=UPI00215DD6CD|nr:M20/M25/M40 family metallo-hydrolase [Paenibacillus sp. MDMC362]
MAASSHFRVHFHGIPGHHSSPHLATDALQMAARYVTEVNSLMANRLDPSEPAVLAFGTLQAGTAINVIAAHSELAGTFRAFRKDIVGAITEGLRRLAASIADQAGGSYQLELREGMAVVNDGAALRRMTQAAGQVLGEEQVHVLHPPSLAGEDFGWYMDQVPGALIVHAIHQPRFDVDEAVLVHGTRIWVRLALHDVYE